MAAEMAQSVLKLDYGLDGPEIETLQGHYNFFFSKSFQRGCVPKTACCLLATGLLRA